MFLTTDYLGTLGWIAILVLLAQADATLAMNKTLSFMYTSGFWLHRTYGMSVAKQMQCFLCVCTKGVHMQCLWQTRTDSHWYPKHTTWLIFLWKWDAKRNVVNGFWIPCRAQSKSRRTSLAGPPGSAEGWILEECTGMWCFDAWSFRSRHSRKVMMMTEAWMPICECSEKVWWKVKGGRGVIVCLVLFEVCWRSAHICYIQRCCVLLQRLFIKEH